MNFALRFLALSTGGIVAISISAVILAAGLFVLLYFTLFSHMRSRRAARELVRKYEYYHGLFFGQDSQYVRRLEIIARSNLLYVNTHALFNKRFREIRDKDDALVAASISKLKEIISERKWREFKEYFPEAVARLSEFEEKVNSINNDLMEVIKPEEECRQSSIALKEKLRLIKADYSAHQADLVLLMDSFEKLFANLEVYFKKFESYIERAQYQEAMGLLPTVSSVIDQVAHIFPSLPAIATLIQNAIPEKILSLSNRLEEMNRSKMPINNIVTRDDIAKMEEKLLDITERVKSFDLRGVQSELDNIISHIDSCFEGCIKEEEAKIVFQDEIDAIYEAESNVEKEFIHLNNELPNIAKIFKLGAEDEAKVSLIKEKVDRSSGTKRTLDTFIHSLSLQPYSFLVEKMHRLKDETQEAQNVIDDFNHYLLSLKEDSESALKTIEETYLKLKEAETILRSINLAPVSEKYTERIDEIYGLIDEAYKELETAPIAVFEIEGIVATMKGKGEILFESIKQEYHKMLIAEAAIVYANRERGHFGEVNNLLIQTEGLYNSGDFERSYDETIKELKKRRSGEE